MSTEQWQIIISGLTPLLLLFLGYILNQRLKDMEQFHWAHQKAVEKRIEFYYSVAPRLLDLLCFFTYTGGWKELKPPDLVKLKRELDKDFYINAPLLPSSVMTLYFTLVDQCYLAFNDWGQDAKLKTECSLRKKTLANGWDDAWDMLFATESITPPQDIQIAFNHLVKELTSILGIDVQNTNSPRASQNEHL